MHLAPVILYTRACARAASKLHFLRVTYETLKRKLSARESVFIFLITTSRFQVRGIFRNEIPRLGSGAVLIILVPGVS